MRSHIHPFFSRRARRAGCLIALVAFAAQLSSARADNATGVTGQSVPIDNRQPTLVMRYMIALQGIFPSGDDETPTQQTAPDRSTPYMGEIRPIPLNFAPRGWALCEGQLLPINQNTALFALLGTTYGGNGQTTFALPDLRGRVPICAGQAPGLPAYVLGQKVGNAALALTRANLPPHVHALPGGGSSQFIGEGAPVDNRQPALTLDFRIAANGEIMIVPWPRNTAGWTRCDGRLLDSATHPLLFQNIGSTYGGDDTNFALPDLRGRVILGDDGTVTWPRGLKVGSDNVVLTAGDIPTHTHTTSGGNTGAFGGAGNTAINYQPSFVLRWRISLFGSFPSPNTGTPSPYVGELRIAAGATTTGLPNGAWPVLNGGLLSTSEHDTLFGLISNAFGGDGQQSFAIPDLRARVAEHAAANVARGTTLGSPTLLISLSQLAAHAHLMDLRILAIQHFANSSAQLTLAGSPGSSCQVQFSDNLQTWSNLATVQFAGQTSTVADPNPTHVERRFYRALP